MTLAKNKGKRSSRRRDKEQPEAAGWMSLARRILVSAGMGTVFFFLLLLPAALLCQRLDIAMEQLPLVGIPLAALAAAVSGYAMVRPIRRQGLALGALAAATLYVVLLLLSWLAARRPLGPGAVILLLAALLGGALGGVAAANRRSRRK
ncbi:MAG: TIGR04086 family membrane protein [Oscillospiraceae bacterium]|nr:TIGR04086 family membrane protein [Oscillospiraceae bacterium]